MTAKHLKKPKTIMFTVRVDAELLKLANKNRAKTWREIIEKKLREVANGSC